MGVPNFKLKAALIEQCGFIARAALELGIEESRLSKIIHRRGTPTQAEKRRIAWRLQKPIASLFEEENGR